MSDKDIDSLSANNTEGPPRTAKGSESSSAVRRALSGLGHFLKRHWMWGILIAGAVYLWQDIRPTIELPPSGPDAPDFELERMNGESFRLSDHHGEVVVLNVWATWCPPCRIEIPGFVDLQEEFADRGVTFVGLSVDEGGLEAVRKFARDRNLNYPQVASRSVAWEKYGGNAVPRTYVIDKQGRIRYRHTGLLLKGSLEPVLEELSGE